MSARANRRKAAGALLSAALLCAPIPFGCARSVSDTTAASSPPSQDAATGTSRRDSPSANTEARQTAFDAEKCWAILKKQCDFGPRPLGSPAHDKTRDYLIAEMKKYADTTVTQEFSYRGMTVTNIIGVFQPEGSRQKPQKPFLLMAHWDTRPIADGPHSRVKTPPFRYGPKGWSRTTPILGANDGASGVAVLLELARLFKEKRPAIGVVILLDDGEDYGDFNAPNGGDGVELGAKYFSMHCQAEKAYGKPGFGILLDMVGAKNLLIASEAISQQYAPGTNDKVFNAAQALGYGEIFQRNLTQHVGDDHLPLNQAGIPTIDLIHPLPYGLYERTGYLQWHTLEDTPENCSSRSLKAVGDVVAAVIYAEAPAK